MKLFAALFFALARHVSGYVAAIPQAVRNSRYAVFYAHSEALAIHAESWKLMALKLLVRGSEYALFAFCIVLGLNELAKVVYLVKYFLAKKEW